MTRKIGLVLGITVLLVFVSSGLIFSQEEAAPEAQVEAQVPAEPAPTEPAPTEAATPLEPEMQWVWGG